MLEKSQDDVDHVGSQEFNRTEFHISAGQLQLFWG